MSKPPKNLKDHLYNIFIWISGSDPRILERCDRYEHIKHAGFGALIIIPTIMAMISMPFAIYMLEVEFVYCLLIGIVWGGIIFTIDRAIVSNMKKGSKVTWGSAGSLVLRLIFATALGIVISDPLVLRLFEPTINETLTLREKGERLSLNTQFDSLVLIEEARVDSFRTQVIQPAEKKRDVFLQLYQWEKNGEKRSITFEGVEYTTSGYGTVGDRARQYGAAIEKEDKVINQLYTQFEELQNQARTNTSTIRQNKINELGKLNGAMTRDYLTRAKYLHELASNNASIKARKWFLIVFLVLVDIIPVLFKAIVPASQYDFWVTASEKASHDAIQHFYQVNTNDKEEFIDSVSEFRRRELTRIFSENGKDSRPLGERLAELERLTNLKWGE